MASFTERTAILVDGGFYRIRAQTLFGDKSPEERADELFSYCISIRERKTNQASIGSSTMTVLRRRKWSTTPLRSDT